MYFSTEQTVSTQPPCLSTWYRATGTAAVAMTWTNVIHFWYHEEVLSLQPMFPPKPSDTLPLEVDAQRRCVQSKPSDTLPLEVHAQRRCVQNTTHTLTQRCRATALPRVGHGQTMSQERIREQSSGWYRVIGCSTSGPRQAQRCVLREHSEIRNS